MRAVPDGLLACVLLGAMTCAMAQQQQTIVHADRVLDVERGTIITNAAIRIEGERYPEQLLKTTGL